MHHSKTSRVLVFVLLISSVLTIGLIPNASSQQFTTSTSFLTSSVTQTLVSYSTSYYPVTSVWTTTNATTIQLGKVQLGSSPPCYEWLIPLNSTGNIHLAYSASGPMTVYFIAWGVISLWSMGGVVWPSPLFTCDTKSLTQMAHESLVGGGVVSISAQSALSGNFDESLDSFQNPWMLAVVAPFSDVNPSLTLTYGPISVSLVTTATASMPFVWVTAATTTLTFPTTMQVPFMQTYGGWIAASVVLLVIAVVLISAVLLGRRAGRKKSSKRRRVK